VTPGQDKFAPKYLVGNVLAGDPAVTTPGPFVYIADPGDGSGIALALTQPNGPGDVWIRPGTYTKTQGRFSVPKGVRVWGAGLTTVIIGSGLDNTIWELAFGAEVAWMLVQHPGPLANLGTSVIHSAGDLTKIHDLSLDASSASGGGLLIAGIEYTGPGDFSWSELRQVTVLGPPKTGVLNPATMFACVRGGPGTNGNSSIVAARELTLGGGDAGVLSVGPPNQQATNFVCDDVILFSPGVVGFYADNCTFLLTHCVVLCFSDTTAAGMILYDSFQYEVSGCFILRLDNPVPLVPGIIVSSPTPPQFVPPASANIHDSILLQWGDAENSVPQILLGQNAELVRSARVVSNRFISNIAVIPVTLGAGCSNSIVGLNTSDGSGGTLPSDLGAGNAPNVNNLWS
jgi:hypothetical protein